MNPIVYDEFLEDYFNYYWYHLGGIEMYKAKERFRNFKLINPSDYWLYDFYVPGAIQTKN